MRSLAEARLKRSRAVELLAEGCTYDQIAKKVGYSHRGSAHRAVNQALTEREVENVEQLRAMELSRLDALQVAVWEQAVSGDAAAAHAVLRIIEQRCRILGLFDRDHHRDGRSSRSAAGLLPLVVEGIAEGNAGEATLARIQELAAHRHRQSSSAP